MMLGLLAIWIVEWSDFSLTKTHFFDYAHPVVAKIGDDVASANLNSFYSAPVSSEFLSAVGAVCVVCTRFDMHLSKIIRVLTYVKYTVLVYGIQNLRRK